MRRRQPHQTMAKWDKHAHSNEQINLGKKGEKLCDESHEWKVL